MRNTIGIALAGGLLATSLVAQTEFEAASIRVNPPESGFHFAADSATGGPGTSDPGLFRCSKCRLATLIGKAFELQNYQFPGRTSLAETTFEVTARIPAGATQQQFQAMLQNLLKERFGLASHFTEKKIRGYQLVVAKGGSKLKESGENSRPQAADTPWGGRGGDHAHNGLIAFGGTARFRGDHQTAGDLARLFSDALGAPVNDQTGLTGKYDVALNWSGNAADSASHGPGGHGDGGFGGGGHGDSGGGAGGAGSGSGEPSGPGLSDAVQAQLGLRLMAAEQVTARIFVIDHVEALPTAN